MNRIHNEKGAALAMVLWIIVLFVLLGTILFAQLATTTNQISKQEESTVESDIANMSAVYVSTYLKQKGGNDGITSQELSDLIDNMPASITIDQLTVRLNPQLEQDQNQIRLSLTIRDDKEVLDRVVFVPLDQ